MKMAIADLTIDEKLKLVMGKDEWTSEDLSGNLPKVFFSDGPVGLRRVDLSELPTKYEIIKSIAYPSFQILSQTRNLDLAKEMGRSLADDCIDLGVDILLAPGVNIKRNPLNGRNFEYFSEDPLVAGLFAKEYIEGLQEKHIGACVKHFCCNNLEYARNRLSMEVDERTLREIYLKPFEIAMKAHPRTMMCSYNLLNGVRMSENAKLFSIAREEFGFDGLMMSDWGAVKTPSASLNAGLNLIMPFDQKFQDILKDDVKNMKLDLNKLDEDAQRVIDLAYRVKSERKKRHVDKSFEERIAVSKKIEEEGLVLAKNDGSLPLKEGTKVVVTGAPAHYYYRGGGSSEVTPIGAYETLEEAFKKLGVDAKFSESVRFTLEKDSNMGNIRQAFKDSLLADAVVMTAGDTHDRECESRDRSDISLAPDELDAIKFLRKATKNLILVVYAGSAIDLSEVYDLCDSIIFAGYGGEKVSEVVAEVIIGKVNPSGRLSETYPLSLYDVNTIDTYKDEACLVYSEGLAVGYRYYETMDVPVLFPFGYGLSYSSFFYSDFEVENTDDGGVKVSLKVSNDSSIDGKDVIQVYVSDLTKCVFRPIKELKAFKKVEVKAHETAEVELTLSHLDFAFYSVGLDRWTVNPGLFKITIAKNAHEGIYEQIVDIA
jgi:beta-glucosidase